MILFFGSICSRISIILNKLIQNISRKYKIKCLFGINGKKLNYINEKQNLENKCLSHLRKNLQSLNCFTSYLIKNTHFTDKINSSNLT